MKSTFKQITLKCV